MHFTFSRTRLLGLLILLTFTVACSRQDDDVLVVYSAGPRPLAESISRAFEAETGIRIELFAATNGQIMAKLEAEKYRPRADVVILASQAAAESLKQQNRLLRYAPEWLSYTRTDWHDPDSFYLATSAATVGIATRQGQPAPRSWEELLTAPTNFGRVTMPSPSRSGSAGDFLVTYTLNHGDSAWHQYRQSRSGGLEFSAANNQAITGLLIGSYDVILAAVDYLIYRQIAAGAALEMHYPEPGPATVVRPIGILNSTHNQEAAKAFVDFYFSDFAQAVVAETHLLPSLLGVELSEVRVRDGIPQGMNFDAVEALREYRSILRRFQIEIERAAVVRSSEG